MLIYNTLWNFYLRQNSEMLLKVVKVVQDEKIGEVLREIFPDNLVSLRMLRWLGNKNMFSL